MHQTKIGESSDVYYAEKLDITIADAFQPAFALVYAADELGLFEKHGLNVSYQTYSSGRDALQGVIDGEADLATVFETPVVLQSYAGANIGIISGLHTSHNNMGVVAKKDHEINRVEDLSGKTDWGNKRYRCRVFLNILLEQHGVTLEGLA